jgi:tellurite resistance protein
MHKKMKFFPITSFAIVLGLGALTILLDKWHYLGWIPELPYTIMLFLVTILFFMFISMYGYKAIVYPDEVRKDFNHRIRVNFLPTISISILILSIIYMGRLPIAALSFWFIGMISQMIFSFIILAKWLSKDVDILYINPAWFIPIIGIILIPVTGVAFFPNLSMLVFYAPAFVMWVVLLTVVLYRVIFHHPLPKKLAPTLSMIIAPPAVAFISYVRIFRQIDSFSLSLLMVAFFFFILMFFMLKTFIKMEFFLSWWSYTFPMAALTIAWTVAYMVSDIKIFAIIAVVSGVITFMLDAFVLLHTLKNIYHGNICVEED